MTTVLPAACAAPNERSVTAVVRGTPIQVSDPSWCVTNHAAEDLAFIEDLSHEGARISMQVPLYGSGTEQAMIAYLTQWPFSRDPEPRLALEPVDDGDAVELDASLAESVARGMEQHAARVRALAGVL